MSKVPQTVTERVWQRIAENGDAPAFVVKNQGPPEIIAVRYGALDVRPKTLDVSWRTYGLMVAEASLFLQQYQIKPGDRVGLLGVDTQEWMVFSRAIQCLGAIVVPLYVDTTPDQIAHVVNNSGTKLIISDGVQIQDKHIKDSLIADKSVKKVLFADVFDKVPYFKGENRTPKPLPFRGWKPTATERPDNFSAATQAEFERLKTLFTTEGADPGFKPTDVNVLIYTSGSTSLPKGAMHTHESIFSSTKTILSLGFDLGPNDVMMHYLPFAHILGLGNGLELCEYAGVVSAFCTKETFKEMMPLFEPTAVLGVPKIWNRLKSEAEKAGNKGLMGHIYRWAFRQKSGWSHAIADLLVFGKIRKKMGLNKVRLTMTGSAACPMETIEFFNTIGIKLREGYGATETCGGIIANTLTEFKYNSLGKAPEGVEYKIVPRPDIDTEANTGKLLVRGDFLFVGYWNSPEKTKQSFDADGWYDTGDIVHEDEDGFLWYRGRASRQKKLDTGEFYGEEAIQAEAENNDLFAAVVPTGEGYSAVGALVFLNKAACKQIAGVSAPQGVEPGEFYAQNEAVVAAIKKAIAETNEKLKLRPEHKKWEQIRCWTVVPVELVQETGLLTSNGLKVKNEEVLKRFADLIKSMYTNSKRS